ncbi:thiamine/thiamine pyrophosphate ABC transporter permease ThiP [Lentibacter algarum]|uniref:thiamine/thiamine pyrophosphate ABC transporter permease ThiP n=1 Tax=Lentibacter algarum TaxID=576131 RepID=UPI001C067D2B|nr:thiamine/thiamine pyrophosphate ABC transporter permease ThiP [Lentibacter algarum]MBU2980551.1 thiamine/thiamine pyrophosphate ABC transporter permease ThiP [Lentibacter algarum]
MARRVVSVSNGAGAVSATLVGVLVLVPIAVILAQVGWPKNLASADWAALRFTVLQAVMSAVLSAVLAVPVARALARRRFIGRGAFVLLMGAPFILPVIVAVLGLLAVFGRAGFLNTLLGNMGLPPVNIYGLHGVVLAHVFFNLPLAVRLLLQGWEAIPPERFRLATALGMRPVDVMRFLEWPMLRERLPGVLLVVFLICLSSFAVALTLGGGPGATTLELAIYEAFRLEFDLARAAGLALVQLALVVAVGLFALRLGKVAEFGAGLAKRDVLWRPESIWLKAQDLLVLGLAAGFVGLPLLAVILKGIPSFLDLPSSVFTAAYTSVFVAFCSMVLCLLAAFSLASARRGWAEVIGLLGLAISPLVLGVGLFLMINPFLNPSALSLPVTVLVNALLALPFALRVLAPEYARVERDYGKLADGLGLQGLARFRLLLWPQMRASLGFAAGLAAALSMGDLGVIALFADSEQATLPLQIYRLMGAYRMDAAAGAALLLLGLSYGLFALLDWGGRKGA